MKLFIDSVNPVHWKVWAERGLLYGATSNPLIFEREGRALTWTSCCDLIDAARELGLQELQFQLYGLEDPQAAVARFRRLFERWPEGLVAKVPLSAAGLATLPLLPRDVPLTFTAAYAAEQALLAAARGARYLAPYYGRLLEAGAAADSLLSAMQRACQPAGCTLLIASLRTPAQVATLLAQGYDCFTLAPAVLDQLQSVETSEAAVAAFEAAARRLNGPGEGQD